MSLDEVTSQLRSFIRNKYNVGDSDREFTDDVHLFDYGYVDSFGAVELISFIQQRYQVGISDQDLVVHSLNTVREIAGLVYQRMAAKR